MDGLSPPNAFNLHVHEGPFVCICMSGCPSSTPMSQYYYGRRFTLSVKLAKGKAAANAGKNAFN